jgi:hypothetical protein
LEEISGRASDASQFQGWEQSLEGGLPARWLPKPWANLPAILLVREEQGENRPAPKKNRFSNQLCAFQDQLYTPGLSDRIPQEEAMARHFVLVDNLDGSEVLKQSLIP